MAATIGYGSAMLDYGQHLNAADARRMACDCTVIPVVLGGESEPLDVGRAQRSVPMGIRRAVVARDRGGAFPGCDQPPDYAKPTTSSTPDMSPSPHPIIDPTSDLSPTHSGTGHGCHSCGHPA